MSTHTSNYLEPLIFNALLRNTSYTPAATVYCGLLTALSDDGTSITEVSGNAYARQALSFAAAASRAVATSAAVTFPEATGSWGTITHVGIFDASSGGNLLFYVPLSPNRSVASGETFWIDSGGLTVTLGGQASDAQANALLDHILRNQAYTPSATPYLALLTAYTDDSTLTEVSGTAYARQAIAFDAPSNGASQNTATVTFPEAGSNWGTVTHLAIYSASSGGNLLARGTLTASKAVDSGKTFRILAGDLDIAVT